MSAAPAPSETPGDARSQLGAPLQALWAGVDTIQERIRGALAGEEPGILNELAREHDRRITELAEAVAADSAPPELQLRVLQQLQADNQQLQALVQRQLENTLHDSRAARQRRTGVNAYQAP